MGSDGPSLMGGDWCDGLAGSQGRKRDAMVSILPDLRLQYERERVQTVRLLTFLFSAP